MEKIILIFLGGGIGSVLRYIVTQATIGWLRWEGLPTGTLVCNVLGCFCIGLIYNLSARLGMSQEVRLLLTVGLCGGFTTFSTFSIEGLTMLTDGYYTQYAIYTVASIGLGLAAALLGAKII